MSDLSFARVFRELGRRGARVLLHPTSPACWEHTSLGRPRPMIEFLFDTPRTVVDLLLNGTIAAKPDLRLIVPHAGAVLPLLADRVSAFAALIAPGADVLGDLRRLHFDLAGHAAEPSTRSCRSRRPTTSTTGATGRSHRSRPWPPLPTASTPPASRSTSTPGASSIADDPAIALSAVSVCSGSAPPDRAACRR